MSDPTTQAAAAAPEAPSVSVAAKKALSDVALVALKTYLPIIGTALANLQQPGGDPVAQAIQAERQVLTSFPEFAQEEVATLAADTNTFVQQLGTYATGQVQDFGGPVNTPPKQPVPADPSVTDPNAAVDQILANPTVLGKLRTALGISA